MLEHLHDPGEPAASGLVEFFTGLTKHYVPRRLCMFGDTRLILLHLVSDTLIAAAYFSIPLALTYLVKRRKDLAFSGIFWLFATFIMACGTTHAMSALALWHPFYRLDGLLKAMTAVVSCTTAVMLWPLLPRVLALPSSEQLKATNAELATLKGDLERRVEERTAELEKVNAVLRSEAQARREAEVARERLLESEQLARHDAERASRLKDEFLAILSHELRTPLTAILGWSTMIREGKVPDDQIGRGLETIERSARTQTQLIDDLLDMSRIVAGKMRLERQLVDLREVLVSAIETVRLAADARGVALRQDLGEVPTEVVGDPPRLEQIFWNLLSNAVKFTPRGGEVSVTLTTVGGSQPQARIVVADTGEGIEASVLPHVFERFRQGDSSSTRTHGGLGLGLSIVKSLTEMHGGEVHGHSEGRGRGTTFVVSLPLSLRVPHGLRSSGRMGVARPRRTLEGLTVLVVDDDPDARMMLQALLSNEGIQVRTADSAAEALASLAEQVPDIVLSDLGMPKVDGYDLMRQIRKMPDPQLSKVPAAALTAFATAEDRKRALKAGFDMHVAKPIDASELLLVLGSLARR